MSSQHGEFDVTDRGANTAVRDVSCDTVYLFLEEALEPAAAERFRAHLLRCDTCTERIQGAWVVADAMTPVVRGAPSGVLGDVYWLVVRARLWLRDAAASARAWRPAAAVAAAVAAGALAAAVAVFESHPWLAATASVDPAVYAPFPFRVAEARLSTPEADVHRPYEPPARKTTLGSGGAAAAPIPLAELSKLEQRGDVLALAAAFLQWAKPKDALERLDDTSSPKVAPDPARVESDRAAIHLYLGESHRMLGESDQAMMAADEALKAADNALFLRPDLVQAQWNRALALRALGAWALAARMFQEIAGRHEPGWSDEAGHKAADLQGGMARRHGVFQDEEDACRRMGEGGEPIPPAIAAAAPGHARACLQEVLRAPPSPERALALLPLAVQLDALDGGTWLSDAIRRGAKSPAAGSPWDALLAEETAAAGEAAAGKIAGSVARMTGALHAFCAPHAPPARPSDLRCVVLQRQLAHVMSTLQNRPVEARAQALAAMEQAKQIGAWDEEKRLLQDMAQIARLSSSVWLVRGYLEEVLEREAPSCDVQDFVHGQLAVTYQNALDHQRARREVEVARRCVSPTPRLTLLFVEADLARIYRPKPEEVTAFQQRLAALRASRREPGTRLMADHIEGRYLLEVEPAAGELLLRHTIRDADGLAENADAFKARTYSYTSLLLDAGKRERFAGALDLFAEEMKLPRAPERCVLGVTAEDERALAVVRDVSGQVRGWYDESRKARLKDASGLVPPALVQALRGCRGVDVIARTPLQGMPGLLPADIPWGYLAGVARSAGPGPAAEKRVVVTAARPPKALELEPLSPYEVNAISGAPAPEVLQGADATPARVLDAMAQATEVRIHGHGVTDRAVSDAPFIALSPDGEGQAALTAGEVRNARLMGRPVVVLIACQTSRDAPYLDEALSLPVAFVNAGARAVFAAASKIPNDEAPRFFEPLLGRLQTGQPPAEALMEAKEAWKANGERSRWVEDVMLFQAAEAR